jgi:alkanesulfonate monooxygenase SsuD/methylene tetrahydromethanopterin reductase-like flavin-dependent oxidoreductase (luciferase family)
VFIKSFICWAYLQTCSLTKGEISFCLEVWGTDYNKIKDACILAEDLGYYGFFYGESLADLDLDCWTVISSLSSLTTKIKLGPVITYLLPQYRGIALVAKQAITLQEISGGRLELRTGAGATLQYATQWWHPYGIDYPEKGKRVSMFNEGIHVLKMLLENNSGSVSPIQSSVSFKGDYFKINGASFNKPAKRIPITIAAKKNQMMRIAAKYADIWESSYLSPTQFSSLNAHFDGLVTALKESDDSTYDHKKILRSIELDVLIAESESELEYKKRVFAMERGPAVYNQILNNGLVGTPDTISKRIKEYTQAGINQFFLAFQDPFDFEALELFINVVKGGVGGSKCC